MSYGDLARFSKSRRWEKCRIAYLSSVNYTCERCHAPAVVVHHRIYLNESNYTDPDISLNPERLEALCINCHNREHFQDDSTVPGVCFDGEGNLVQSPV